MLILGNQPTLIMIKTFRFGVNLGCQSSRMFPEMTPEILQKRMVSFPKTGFPPVPLQNTAMIHRHFKALWSQFAPDSRPVDKTRRQNIVRNLLDANCEVSMLINIMILDFQNMCVKLLG